jgi:spore maturation protein A
MNWIWAFLVLFSFAAALFTDVREITQNRWENDKVWTFRIAGDSIAAGDGRVRLLSDAISDTLFASISTSGSPVVTFSSEKGLPESLKKRFQLAKDSRKGLQSTSAVQTGNVLSVTFKPVRWLKMTAIAEAAFDMAKTAVTLAIGLIGAMALWLGIMNIAEQSGLMHLVVKAVRPVIGKLFPDIPKDDPALGHISLNLAANVLGLGNAATPLGIKAMESLKKHIPDSDEASDAMCMFLAINTSSVQLLPPVTLVALMGTSVAPLMVSITLATIVSTSVAVLLALRERKRRRKHG